MGLPGVGLADEEVIVHMAAGLLGAYRYFRSHRQVRPSAHTIEPRRGTPKVGRNDPCPCGSGKKYKECCGGAGVDRLVILIPPHGSAPTPHGNNLSLKRFHPEKQ